MRSTPDLLESLRPTLKYNCNLALLNYLAGFPVRRKVTIAGESYLQFRNPRVRKFEDSMFLPLKPPGTPVLETVGGAAMREFYSAFDGLRETEPPVCGNFVPCDQVVTVRSEFSLME